MIEAEFKTALDKAGLSTKDKIIADGKLHRIRVEGDKPGSKNGWYVLFEEGVPAGSFGSCKTGDKSTWCAKADRDLTLAQREENRRRMIEARAAREAEEQARRNAARDKAFSIWKASTPASDTHPYLVKKGVGNHGLRLHKTSLVIPMRDSAGNLHSLQFIDDDGNKRFLSGGRKKGCYYLMGLPVEPFCVAEGYATAVSIYEATLYPVAVAFDAGNLKPVAEAIYSHFQKPKIIICADNDINTPGNPGLMKAREAAAAVEGLLSVAGGAA